MNPTRYFIVQCKHCKQEQKMCTKKNQPTGSRICVYCNQSFGLGKNTLKKEVSN